MLCLDTIVPDTLALLKRIQALPEFAQTRLVGGTALALQLGHRISVDLDLFGCWSDDADLFAALQRVGKVRKSSGTPDVHEIFACYSAKYPEANPALALRSMAYFVDAETMPLPRMLQPFDWDAAKAKIQAAVRNQITPPPKAS